MYLRILFCHILLFGFAFGSPVETKISKKSMPEPPTEAPVKATTKNINKEQVQSINNAQTERPTTKKRDVPGYFTDRKEYFDDEVPNGRSSDDYDSIHALKKYLDSARNYNEAADSDRFRDSEAEVALTPEEILTLAMNAYRQQQLLQNDYPYGQWSDNQIDLPDPEVDSDDEYERPDNFFNRYYDQRYQNWANLPRNNRFIPNRQIRSFPRVSKLRVPLYRRAIL